MSEIKFYMDSISPGFILDAVNDLETYCTPKVIIEFIKSEQIKSIIGNPPIKSLLEKIESNGKKSSVTALLQ